MHEERNESNLVGQIAGLIAMMSALVKTLPPTTRKRLLLQTQAEFESLLAVMSTTSASKGQTEREGVEWMRDLFLKRIAQADSKQRTRKVRTAPEQAGPRTAQKQHPRAAKERPSSADVDLEL